MTYILHKNIGMNGSYQPIIKSFEITAAERELILKMAHCKKNAVEFYKHYNQLNRKDLNLTLQNFHHFYFKPLQKPKAATKFPALLDQKKMNPSTLDIHSDLKQNVKKVTGTAALPAVTKRYILG